MDYQLSFKKCSQTIPTKVVMTVHSNNEVLFAEQVDVGRDDKRSQFVDSLIEKCPGLKSESDTIDQRLMKIAHDLVTVKPSETECPQKTPLEESQDALDETDPELIQSAKELLTSPDLIRLIIKHLKLYGLVGEKTLGLALYLTFTSRLLSKPLAVVVLGVSSSGKSFAIISVGGLFPPEAVYRAHRITPAALQYLPNGSLIHRAVIAGERSRRQDDDQAEATRALREMISDGVLRIMVTGKDGSGKLTTHHVEQSGPIAYAESTTLGLSEIFDEDKTRFLFLCCDESEDQSRKIIGQLALQSQSPMKRSDKESITNLHYTVQRLLKPYEVIIPFANQLTDCFPTHRPESRRAFGHLLSLIKSVALLHQYQREKNNEEQIIATLDDYEIIRQYLTDPIGRGLGLELTAGAAGLLNVIESNYGYDDEFTVSNLIEYTGLGKILYDRMKELRRQGYVSISQPHQGSNAAQYKRNLYPDQQSGLELPDLKKTMFSS